MSLTERRPFEVELALAKMKSYNLAGREQILADIVEVKEKLSL
jgi:hypothetical protein